ncbi:hypothetical protein PLICRDRAFT_321995 [Plicaturopsis crispa FD-325 SS-3]|nr:hypothetical protein PLICRDRAFT_321995 [Plicaturopsis crispa FD-325 SS-3]
MHFSKTYASLLLTLPPELRDNAIQYRQLKKLINKVVNELESLGLSPEVLQELLENGSVPVPGDIKGKGKAVDTDALLKVELAETATAEHHPRLVYELSGDVDHIEPRLRFLITNTPDKEPPLDTPDPTSLRWILQTHANPGGDSLPPDSSPQEVVVPLVSDTAFFHLLSTALQSLSLHLLKLHADFIVSLSSLARAISFSARPASATPHATAAFTLHAKSDLAAWREIFRIYLEAEIFESVAEASRGERTVEDSEQRLHGFLDRIGVRESGAGSRKPWLDFGFRPTKLHLAESKSALKTFVELNVFVLNLKKFQYANVEATRKILKKHTKRTALPLPPGASPAPIHFPTASSPQLLDLASLSSKGFTMSSTHQPNDGLIPNTTSNALLPNSALLPQISLSFPRILVQAIGETLLPLVPHIDDYACLICTSLAYTPVRLFCGHLFCVRCLVKMQKRGQDCCPMCRAPTVLSADRSNVDKALVNFMQDWFPNEAAAKRKANEREAAEEELLEMGFTPDMGKGCVLQ